MRTLYIASNNGLMIRLIVYFVIFTACPFCCQAQQIDGLTYKQKLEIITDNSAQCPEEAKLADKLFRLTERSIVLSDSLIGGILRSGGLAPFSVLSTDPTSEKFFNTVKDSYSIAIRRIGKGNSMEKINKKLIELAAIDVYQTWVEKFFKGKSLIESLAAFRELQTACLELTDFVFDEIISRNKIK